MERVFLDGLVVMNGRCEDTGLPGTFAEEAKGSIIIVDKRCQIADDAAGRMAKDVQENATAPIFRIVLFSEHFLCSGVPHRERQRETVRGIVFPLGERVLVCYVFDS